MNYDNPDAEIQISQVEEDFLEELFEALCNKEIDRENPETPVK